MAYNWELGSLRPGKHLKTSDGQRTAEYDAAWWAFWGPIVSATNRWTPPSPIVISEEQKRKFELNDLIHMVEEKAIETLERRNAHGLSISLHYDRGFDMVGILVKRHDDRSRIPGRFFARYFYNVKGNWRTPNQSCPDKLLKKVIKYAMKVCDWGCETYAGKCIDKSRIRVNLVSPRSYRTCDPYV